MAVRRNGIMNMTARNIPVTFAGVQKENNVHYSSTDENLLAFVNARLIFDASRTKGHPHVFRCFGNVFLRAGGFLRARFGWFVETFGVLGSGVTGG